MEVKLPVVSILLGRNMVLLNTLSVCQQIIFLIIQEVSDFIKS